MKTLSYVYLAFTLGSASRHFTQKFGEDAVYWLLTAQLAFPAALAVGYLLVRGMYAVWSEAATR